MNVGFLNGRVQLRGGDCLAVIKTLDDNSIDSAVMDPPYALGTIAKRFSGVDVGADTQTSADARSRSTSYARLSSGFMGKKWDTGETAFAVEFWEHVLRVLKPGGHVVAFGGTRSYHRLACAIEDAGFDIRDQLAWVYGTGFPKSHSVSKGIDRSKGVIGVVGEGASGRGTETVSSLGNGLNVNFQVRPAYTPATDEARQWDGWGTALKPSWEPICLARKPLSEKTVAANVLRWGTGALNIDGTRIGVTDAAYAKNCSGDRGHADNRSRDMDFAMGCGSASAIGRWPANVVHDGSDEVVAAFPDSKGQQGDLKETGKARPTKTCFGDMAAPTPHAARNDSGSAARFFYCAKAGKADRAGSKHPTVKPVKLMQWLCKLVTPPGGIVFDPFAGSGSTGVAAFLDGFRSLMIEREPEYLTDIATRMGIIGRGLPDVVELEEAA